MCTHCPDGVIKPDITFFGERLPASINRAVDADSRVADLVLVMGTSLKVAPVSKIIQRMPWVAPQVRCSADINLNGAQQNFNTEGTQQISMNGSCGSHMQTRGWRSWC